MTARAVLRESAAEKAAPPIGKLVRVGEHIVHAVVMGQGPDLVMLHGASGNLREFDELSARLARHFRLFLFDRPGLGHSEGLNLKDVGLSAQARHLAAAARQLGAESPLILGHSYGGAVALAWALEGLLNPRGLLLVSAPTMPWDGQLDRWYQITDTALGQRHLIPTVAAFVPEFWLRRMVTTVFTPEPVPAGYFQAKAIPLAIRRDTLRHNTAQINQLLPDLRAQEPQYRRLALPVEIIHGTGDKVVPHDLHSRALARLLPEARLSELAQVGHMPHLTRQSDVEAAALRLAARAGLHLPSHLQY